MTNSNMPRFPSTSYWLALVFTCMGTPWAIGQTLPIVVDEYPPYIDSAKADHGFLAHIVADAFAKSGISVEFVYAPWKRIESIEIDKHHQLSMGFIPTPERAQKWHYSDSIIISSTTFVVLKSKRFAWQTLDDLKAYKIGLSRGYSYGPEFDAVTPQMNVEYAATDEINIKKVLKGRIDIFPVDPYVGAELIRTRLTQKQRQKLDMVDTPNLSSDSMHVVCARTFDPCLSLLQSFNRGLAIMNKDGSLQAIIKRAMSIHDEDNTP